MRHCTSSLWRRYSRGWPSRISRRSRSPVPSSTCTRREDWIDSPCWYMNTPA
ncbi:Uncharacterised protein [Bordetella pertussis]|nr:Uncharacterised protein [Bordetella pertussis]